MECVRQLLGWFARTRVRRGMDAVTGCTLLGFGAALAAER
jgi:hypothetical protein